MTVASMDTSDLEHQSKRALLNHLNKLLQLKLSRLEQCANGAAYCQLLDAYFPGLIPMHKVNFAAKEDSFIWHNYKVLQAAFVQLEITKHMDVPRLSKGHAADNLELLQWLHKFLRSGSTEKLPIDGYQPKQRRQVSKGGHLQDLPVPSCLAANFDFRRMNESQSPGSPVSSASNKGRVWSSRDIVGGKVDLSHVVSRYKEGLAQPVLVPRPKTAPLSPLPPADYERPVIGQSTASLSTQTEEAEAFASTAESADAAAYAAVAFSSTGVMTDDAMDAAVYATRAFGTGGKGKLDFDSTTQALAQVQLESPGGVSARAAEDESGEPVQQPALDMSSAPSMELGDQGQAASPTRSSATGAGDAARYATPHLPPDAASLYMSALASSGYLPFTGTEALSDALATAQDALEEVQNIVPGLQQQQQLRQRGTAGEPSLVFRGQLRSMLVATRTLLQHTSLLLTDVQTQCSAQGVPLNWEPQVSGVQPAAERAAVMLQLLAALGEQFEEAAGGLQHMCNISEIKGDGGPQEPAGGSSFSAALCTTQLDAVAKAVGQAHFALTQAIHKRGAALAASFLQASVDDGRGQDAAGPSGRGATTPSTASRAARCFKLGGGLQLKKLRNGDVYRGHYHSGKKNGDGVYHFLNHDVYEGEFKGDRMDGYGVYTFSHEGRYEGQWHSAVYAGHGTETFSKGSTYFGQYSAGLRNGCGACRFFNGDYYEGSWSNGLRDGQGMQQCTDDSNYVGEYVKGKRHGHGVYSFPNGDRYQGEYADDLPHGHGVYLFASGQKYEGEWSQGKKHGWSIYTVDNGQQFVGQWLDSKPQWIQALKDPDAEASDAADAAEQVPDEIQDLASAACDKAKLAAQRALECAERHWTHTSPVSVSAAVVTAAQAAAQAQAARQRAMQAAMQLNLAVAIQHADPSKDEAVKGGTA